MEIMRNLRIYGNGTRYYLIINKKGVEKQKLYFDSIPKLKAFLRKYKKRIVIKKPKQPKKTFNNIIDNLGIAKISYNPLWQMEVMKNEQMQNEINKLWEKINKLDLEKVEKGENILTDTDYNKKINTSTTTNKLKYKYPNPKPLTKIIEETKHNKTKSDIGAQTTDIFNNLDNVLKQVNEKFEFEKAIKSDLPITNLSDISDLSGDGVLLYGNGISNNTINKIMSNFKWFGYIGCYSFDELHKVFKYIVKKKLNHFSFILNTADNNKDQKNPFHWVSVYCDNAWLEYYDCWGQNIRFNDFKYIASKY